MADNSNIATGIKDWSKTPSENSKTPPYGFPEGMQPASLNDCNRQNMAFIRQQWENMWFDLGYKYTYVAMNKLQIEGDKTSDYPVGLRLKIKMLNLTIYCDVVKVELRTGNTVLTVSSEDLKDSIAGVERGIPLDMYNPPNTELHENKFYKKGYFYKYENYYKVSLKDGVFKSADWKDATKFEEAYISDYEQSYIIFTQTSGKYWTKNADGSTPSGVDSSKVWSLSEQEKALGGTAPSGKTHIELPVGTVTFFVAGGGGGGGHWDNQNGNDGGTSSVGTMMIAGGGYGGRGGGTRNAVSHRGNGRGGAGGIGSCYSNGANMGMNGSNGDLQTRTLALTAGQVIDYKVGVGGSGQVSPYGTANQKASAGSNGSISVKYKTKKIVAQTPDENARDLFATHSVTRTNLSAPYTPVSSKEIALSKSLNATNVVKVSASKVDSALDFNLLGSDFIYTGGGVKIKVAIDVSTMTTKDATEFKWNIPNVLDNEKKVIATAVSGDIYTSEVHISKTAYTRLYALGKSVRIIYNAFDSASNLLVVDSPVCATVTPTKTDI